MNKRKRILLIAVAAFIVCALGFVIFLSHEPPEPMYEGKSLSYWLAGYDSENYRLDHLKGPSPPSHQGADEAIGAMGTNAIPKLLTMLQRHDSKFKTAIWGLLHRQNFIQIPSLRLDQDRVALIAFLKLGSTASNAVSELIHIYDTDPSPFAQTAVPGIISSIGPAARPAIPMLLRAVTHTNEIVRYNSVYALGKIHAEPERTVPALIKCLNDSDAIVQVQAIQALTQFGTNALPGVPALVELLGRESTKPAPRGNVRFFGGGFTVSSSWSNYPPARIGPSSSQLIVITQDAIRKIDPDAAAKAGIK